MQKFNKTKSVPNVSNTSFKGIYLHTDLIRLHSLLGECSIEYTNDKVTFVWMYIKNETETTKEAVITIYDYKSNNAIDETIWHIGGKNVTKKSIIQFLKSKGFEKIEIEIENNPLYK